MSALGEHRRTIACAELALDKIKDLGQTGDPRTFAAWFTYASNCSPSQNIAIDEAIAVDGDISAGALEKVYGYAPANLITDSVDRLAAGVVGEVEHVMATIDQAVGRVAAYRDNIAAVTERLGRARDRESLRAIVDRLVQATRSMAAVNGSLVASLKASRQEITLLQHKVEALRADSLIDALTSLANRRHFDRELERCTREADGDGGELCLLLMDVDHFKRVNNTFGRLAGDEVLRVIAHLVKQHVQPNDVAARIGGEEFAVILPATRLRSALTVADHIRCRVTAMEFMKRSTGESIGGVGMSGGIARYRPGEPASALMQRADNCLLAAKRHGRNRVICDNEELVAGPV